MEQQDQYSEIKNEDLLADLQLTSDMTADMVRFTNRLAEEKSGIETRVVQVCKHVKNAYTYSQNKSEFYSIRNELSDKRFKYMSTLSQLMLRIKKVKRHMMDIYKTGGQNIKTSGLSYEDQKKELSKASGYDKVLKNEGERDVYYEYDLRNYEYIKVEIDNHIKFLLSKEKMIENIIYNEQNVIELEKYNATMR